MAMNAPPLSGLRFCASPLAWFYDVAASSLVYSGRSQSPDVHCLHSSQDQGRSCAPVHRWNNQIYPSLDLTIMLPLGIINPERDGGESEAAVSKERPDAYPEDGGEAAR
jgi:hypothetical protein